MAADDLSAGQRPRVVVALGGNAISMRHQPLDAAPQSVHVRAAIDALAPLTLDHDVVITHGNGPQVGLLALESASDATLQRPYPFDALGAETQGLIGYWLLQALDNAVPDRRAIAVITRTLVSPDDTAFAHPAKFIGPSYSETQARTLASKYGWTISPDGDSWRRVVPSPDPVAIVEIDDIGLLVRHGAIVICGGGGGVPVVRRADGDLVGVEAVVDKDLTAALIAESVGATALLLLTDVTAVSLDIDRPAETLIARTTASEMRRHAFAPGSMGSKVDAACRFVERTGNIAVIGALSDAAAMLAGTAGTIITPTARSS